MRIPSRCFACILLVSLMLLTWVMDDSRVSAGEAVSTAVTKSPPTAASSTLTSTEKRGQKQNPPPPTKSLIERVWKTFQQGGAIMWVLLGTSIVGLTFGLERLLGLRRRQHIPTDLLLHVNARLDADGVAAAREILTDTSSALARVLHGLLLREGATRAELEQIVEDESSRVLWELRHRIRVVGIVASVAPLLGLLGTVFGLINAFSQAAELGMDNPKNFAEGIYVALYTTAFGLTIAIPSLVFYHFLRGRADVIVREVEEIAIGFAITVAPRLAVASEEAADADSA